MIVISQANHEIITRVVYSIHILKQNTFYIDINQGNILLISNRVGTRRVFVILYMLLLFHF